MARQSKSSTRSKPDDLGAAAAMIAENAARQARAEAEASYFRGVAGVVSSMPGQLPPNGGGMATRTDTAWDMADYDAGNWRYQNPQELWQERQRSRQLEQTNWLASAVLDRVNERVIGTIMTVEPQTGKKRFDTEVRDWLKGYWYTRACDIRNRFGWSELSHLFFRAHMRDGDALLVFTEDRQRNPKLQLIESQRIRQPTTGPLLAAAIAAGNTIVDGVEMDSFGAPVAYYVSTRPMGKVPSFVRVDERDCMYLGRTSRYGNVRGEPSFRGGYWLFDQIMGYLEAVVVAARVGACQAMIQYREDPGTSAIPNAIGASRPNGSVASYVTGQQNRTMPITPGAINVLGINEKLTAFNPAQPTQSFPEAIDVFARFIGIRFGLTLEDILLKFSGLSWSSSKASKNASMAASAVLQHKFGTEIVSRSYQWALSKAVKNGTIRTPPPPNFWKHEWLPPVWPSVDPLKDIQAGTAGLAIGIDARRYLAASLNGYDFADLCEVNAADRDLLEAKNLSTVIPVGNSQAGAAPASGKSDERTDHKKKTGANDQTGNDAPDEDTGNDDAE